MSHYKIAPSILAADYANFEQKKKYLSSKLLTYFAEHPLFFFGYSCSDPNIISIVSDIDEILAFSYLLFILYLLYTSKIMTNNYLFAKLLF